MHLFCALLLSACAAVPHARAVCFKSFGDAEPPQPLRPTHAQTWSELEAGCAALRNGWTLVQYVEAMSATEKAACGQTIVPFGVYESFDWNSIPPMIFHWSGSGTPLETDDLVNLSYVPHGSTEGVGVIDLSTGEWGFASKTQTFECALCQLAMRVNLNEMGTLKQDPLAISLDSSYDYQTFSKFVDFEILLVGQEVITDWFVDTANDTAENFTATSEDLVNFVGVTQGQVHFSHTVIDDQGHRELYLHLTSDSLEDMAMVDDSLLGKTFGQGFEVRGVRRMSPCPIEDFPEGYEPVTPEFYFGREEIDPKIYPIGRLQLLVNPERELVSQRKCIRNETSSSLSWSRSNYWKVLWQNCTAEGENSVNHNIQAILTRRVEKQLEALSRTGNCTDLEELVELGNSAIKVGNNLTKNALKSLTSRLSLTTLDDGADFCLTGRTRLHLLVSDLNVSSPVIGIKLDIPRVRVQAVSVDSNLLADIRRPDTGMTSPGGNATMPEMVDGNTPLQQNFEKQNFEEFNKDNSNYNSFREHSRISPPPEDFVGKRHDNLKEDGSYFQLPGENGQITFSHENFSTQPLEDLNKDGSNYESFRGSSGITSSQEYLDLPSIEYSNADENSNQSTESFIGPPQEVFKEEITPALNGNTINPPPGDFVRPPLKPYTYFENNPLHFRDPTGNKTPISDDESQEHAFQETLDAFSSSKATFQLAESKFHAVYDKINTTDRATEFAVVVKGFAKSFQRLTIVVAARRVFSSSGQSTSEAYERTVFIELSNADSTLPDLDLDDDGYFIDIANPFLDETVDLRSEQVLSSCVAWNSLTGSWSAMTCRKRKGLLDAINMCRCRAKHMIQDGGVLKGTFAVKIAIDSHFAGVDSSHLDIFQYVDVNVLLIVFTVFECVISTLGLLSFLLTAVFNKSWREDVGHKILLHMVMALFVNLVLGFLTDYLRLDTEGVGCIAIGVLRHYSFLVMFLWMLVLSGLQMKRLMTVAGAKATSHLVLKVALFAWGLPVLPIAALLAWNARIYRSDRYDRGYCYPEGIFFQVTVQGPAAFILFVNLLVFVAILRHIFECCSGEKITKHSKNERAQQMRRVATSVFIFFLFGFTWVLHYLSEENVLKSNFLFEYLFLMTATTHISVLALFFVILDEKVRGFWLEKLTGKCCC